MYLKRKIDRVLTNWKTSEKRLPLIIRGPRQVGKTAAVRHFAASHYESVIEINFVESPKYRVITEDGLSAADVIRAISLIDPGKRFIPGKTLIFFDEIQAFPSIAATLKFFAEDARFDVICSGSLLGLSYREIESISVGYKQDVTLRSLDFEEFLWSQGYSETLADELLSKLATLTPFSAAELTTFQRLFTFYSILGGMPAVLASFAEKGTFEGTLEIQRQLLADYEEDIQKYLNGLERTRVLNVFRQIPAQLARENKKFQVSKVARGARAKDYWGCVEWLENAGLILRCSALNFPELPIRGNTDPDRFKLYFHDTGLLVASLDEEAQEDLRVNRNLGVYKGALFENFVGAALAAEDYDLCYYKRDDSTLEEDFFVRTADALVPVEVKAGKNRSKSLSTLIQSDKYPDIRFGVKFTGGNVGFESQVVTLPWFCAFLLRRFLKEQRF